MSRSTTRQALLEQGALLYARHGVAGVSAKRLHEAVGSRNESALHYHFGDHQGLVRAILREHVEAVEARRAALVAAAEAEGRSGDVRTIVHVLAAPMAADLDDRVGRAHLRLVAQLDHPSLAYRLPFERIEAVTGVEASAGAVAVTWLTTALDHLPERVRVERLVALRAQLIGLFGARAQLLDDDPARATTADNTLFLENLLDVLVAGLTTPPSEATLAAIDEGTASARR